MRLQYNKKAAQYELVLNKADVNHIIMFSDRPYRIVKYITGKNLAADWSVGSHSFKADPPNAVISGAGMKAEIVILSSIHVKDQHISFGFQGYTGGLRHLGGITVVIDYYAEPVPQRPKAVEVEVKVDTMRKPFKGIIFPSPNN